MPPTGQRSQVRVTYADYAYHYEPYRSRKRRSGGYHIRLQVEGQCRLWINGERLTVLPGDLTFTQPGDTVQVQFDAEPDAKSKRQLISGNYYLSCGGVWLEQWWRQSERATVVNIPLHQNVLSIFQAIVLEHRLTKIGSGDNATAYLLRALCLILDRMATESSTGKENELLQIAQRMKHYIAERATLPLRVDEVAKHAGLSPSRAAHLFKSVFNQTIMEYAIEVRLSIASDRMKFTTMTLDKIAETSGFGSYTYFHRVFRAKYGISPTQYRQKK
ncbi:AraC family transcriptional regulator [Paenibacillus hemerocallicola]|uniref:AraC family transcriptional regulator n=1 Tax=Paenibacillus hemerocallicola TaxID=1172614 RepID=UPI00159EEAB8|nr:AraC family transcriptional regulator [Paenibacillus hemerocallicola]